MNKNRSKAIFLSLVVALFAFSTFLAPLAKAVTVGNGGGGSNNYVEIPLSPFTRPVVGLSFVNSGCNPWGGGSTAFCQDVTAEPGIYNFVGKTHAIEPAAITSVEVMNQNDINSGYVPTTNFAVVGSSLRVYGLTLNQTYKIAFAFDDKKTSDITTLVSQVSKLCPIPSNTGSGNAYKIAANLVNGCSRYNSEPFLPAVIAGTDANGGQFFKYDKPIVRLTSVTVKTPIAAAPALPSNTNPPDGCAIDPAAAMRWLECPMLGWGEDATNMLDSFIQNFLFAPTEQIFSPEMKSAWNSFRIMGVVLVLIAGLTMVISQAMGLEIFDAYTVKKVLPRLLIAAIGISLSWPIMQFVITFFNDLGVWSHDIILFPFRALQNNAGGSIIAGGVGITASIPVAILVMGPAIFPLLGTIVLGLLIALVVLTLRQLVIIVAVLLAPLAIAAYILPGTQKLWEFWKNTFLTTLYMFPIIMAFIASGKALALVAAGVKNNPQLHVLSVVAYFAPYFLLPFAFKLAGGLMATVFSVANDKNRGAFDRLRKTRQEMLGNRRKRASSNSLWDPNSRMGKLNSAASWVASPVSNAAYLGRNHGPFKNAGSRIGYQINQAKAEQSGKLFEEINKMGYNDKAYRALSGVHTDLSEDTQKKFRAAKLYGRAPGSLKELQQMGDILSSSSSAGEQIAGNAMSVSAGRLATLYKDEEMMKASIGAAGIMGLAAHGFASSGDLSAAGNLLMGGNKENAGYAQSIVSQAQMMGARSRPDTKPGYGVVYKDGNFVDGMSDEGGRMSAVLDTFNSSDLASAKGGAIKTVRPEIERRLSGSKGENFARAQKDQLFSWAGPYSQASADVKAQALDIIYEKSSTGQSVRPDIAAEFERYTRSDMGDPGRRGQAGGPPEDAPPQQPGGGGGR